MGDRDERRRRDDRDDREDRRGGGGREERRFREDRDDDRGREGGRRGGGGGREERSRSRGRRRDRKSPSGSPVQPRMKQRPSGFDQKEMLPENYAMMQMALMKTPPPMAPGGTPGAGAMGGGAGMAGMMMPPTNTVTNPEVELFLQHNPVEPHAATRLRSLPVELQKIVLSRGSLFGGRDPTAVLLGRVRAATRGLTGPQLGASQMPWSGAAGAAPEAPAQQPAPDSKPQPRESWEAPASSFVPQAQQPAPISSQMPVTGAQMAGQEEPMAAWSRFTPGGNYGKQYDYGNEYVEKQKQQQQQMQQQQSEPETEEQKKLRGMMQSSLGALSVDLLGKNAAQQAGLVEEEKRLLAAGGAPSLNPFRSKPRAAPVATEPDPPPMASIPAEFNLQHTPDLSAPPPMPPPPQQEFEPPPMAPPDEPMPPPQQMFMGPPDAPPPGPPGLPALPAGPSFAKASGPPPGMAPPPPQEPKPPEQRLWSPSAQDLADLGVPPGIAVRMIRENQILADEDNMPIIPYEGDSQAPEETAALEVTSKADVIPTSAKALALAEETKAQNQAVVNAEPEKPKDTSGASEIKRAQAIATLSYYGLTDPTNQEDVAKAVQAVAAATGDQATAVALWHMIIGSEEGAGTSLTEAQIEEVQQAAQQAQYSQYWLQQQFQSQLAMFENQRLMATGDNPVTNVEDARESALKGPRGDPAVSRRKPSTNQPMLPGDWTCPGCGDHQFARNRVCRFCGASRPLGSH